MNPGFDPFGVRMTLATVCVALGAALVVAPASSVRAGPAAPALRAQIDAPLLFVKRLNYLGIHIYDTYYKWRPGGGIYVLENPQDPPAKHRVRAVIDATTPGTLGGGIYSDPDLSWDAKHVLFCYKPSSGGSTSIYEIGTDGSGLRRVTNPEPACAQYKGSHGGVHDITPCYLPDGRIALTTTRFHGLVPCANEGVNILHVMNADGSDMHPISVNNVNEFDPCVLPDGRLVLGRWEYIDKTALTQQSLWTVFPDGTNETALYANNMVHPEAILDARPVPGTENLVVGTFTPHNAPPRGTIGMVDIYAGKNAPGAITNFDRPTQPTYDRGDSCEPWPLSKDVVLHSGRFKGQKHNAIVLVDRAGRRELVYGDPRIDCHSPMLLKPRRKPPAVPLETHPDRRNGRLLVQNVYEGLDGVQPGQIKFLRVIEETSRVSATPGGAMNQTFLISAVLGWSAKNFLGVAPVEADGSAYFEVPSGRAIYLQALDGEGRLVRSMRTFIQAAPGTTRSCIGCHEYKYSAAAPGRPLAGRRAPSVLRDELWGSGFVDYPSMVQPVFDKHCVSCHGGEKGFGGGLDLTGGWTQYFSISYENLVSRRKNQLTAHLISGIDCMNGTAYWSAQILGAYAHGSGHAPLAKALVGGHKDRIGKLTRRERDLVLAWIDTNGIFHGTWDYSRHGCSVKSWQNTKAALATETSAAGCTKCHGGTFETDWFNLQRPALSRVLRAPLAKGAEGGGLALCRDRKVTHRARVRLLARGQYLHGAMPSSKWLDPPEPPKPTGGKPVVSFTSADDPRYQKMLSIIRRGRQQALAAPRVDMPGAEVIPGEHRVILAPPLPDPLPALSVHADADGVVQLSWERSARTIGLTARVHRGDSADFEPTDKTLLAETPLFQHTDADAPPGARHYAMVLDSDGQAGPPIRAAVTVPLPAPPQAPVSLKAAPGRGRVRLTWAPPPGRGLKYHVYRDPGSGAGTEGPGRLTAEPIGLPEYSDAAVESGAAYRYFVRAVSRRGAEGPPSAAVSCAALPEIKTPVFAAEFTENARAVTWDKQSLAGRARGKARVVGGALDVTGGGYVTFAHREEFDLTGPISIECWVRLARPTQMPVIVGCGHWRKAGWFLQRIGAGYRWHVGGIDCDGGAPAPGRWTHLVMTWDGQAARLFQDGKLVATQAGQAVTTRWPGELHVGQYSGGPDKTFQVLGQIARVRVYSRALPAADVAATFQNTPAPGAK